MSNFAILREKLDFLRMFYDLSTQPFREIKRKIDVSEEPYIARWNGEEPSGDPPFLSEWLEADEALKLQEQVCLSLLQRSFREFLVATVRQHSDYPNSKPNEKGNWFEHYRKWFYEECAIDWTQAPGSLSRIEELTFARNCIQHGGESDGGPEDVHDSYKLLKEQSVDYHVKFPDAFFASEFERAIWKESNYPQPVTIELTPDKLDVAIKEIVTFCQYIDEHLPAWML